MSFVIGKGKQICIVSENRIKWPEDVKAQINAAEVNRESILKRRNCSLLVKQFFQLNCIRIVAAPQLKRKWQKSK